MLEIYLVPDSSTCMRNPTGDATDVDMRVATNEKVA